MISILDFYVESNISPDILESQVATVGVEYNRKVNFTSLVLP